MRFISRSALSPRAHNYLAGRRSTLQFLSGARLASEADRLWRRARATAVYTSLRHCLNDMAGPGFRCYYCEASEGSDVDHYRPRSLFPLETFSWTNLLLLCSICNRFKGSFFPIASDLPLLLDPTRDDPWQHIYYDQRTGMLAPRYLKDSGSHSARGRTTIELLHLNREPLVEGRKSAVTLFAKIAGGTLPHTQLTMPPPSDAELRKIVDCHSLDHRGLLAHVLL